MRPRGVKRIRLKSGELVTERELTSGVHGELVADDVDGCVETLAGRSDACAVVGHFGPSP